MSKHITSIEMKIIESNLDNNTSLKDIALSVQKIRELFLDISKI